MKKFIVLSLSVILSLVLSIPVFAADLVESADNQFIYDENLSHEFNINGDIAAFGTTVDLTGDCEGDIIASGQSIYITSDNVGGSIRTISSSVNISAGNVRNITSAAESILINENTTAKGVYLFADNVDFYGNATDLYVYGNDVYIDGVITGNVKINCSTLTLGKNAEINGSIDVTASETPSILGDFDISRINLTIEEYSEDSYSITSSALSMVLKLVTSVIIGLLLILISRKFLESSSDKLVSKPWLPFVSGTGVLITLPIIAILLCFTVVCIPVSIIAFIIYCIAIYLSPVVAGIITGKLVFKRNSNIFLTGIAGIVIVKALTYIPVIGGIVYFATIIGTLGLITLEIIDRIHNNSKQKPKIDITL